MAAYLWDMRLIKLRTYH